MGALYNVLEILQIQKNTCKQQQQQQQQQQMSIGHCYQYVARGTQKGTLLLWGHFIASKNVERVGGALLLWGQFIAGENVERVGGTVLLWEALYCR